MGVVEAGGGFDLEKKALRAECSSELGSQNLDRDLATMFLVMGEIDGRHPPSAELPLNLVPVAQGGFQASEQGRQRVLQVASDLS